MSKRSGAFKKGRASRGPFLAIPREVMNSPAWAKMTAHEVKLVMDVAAAYRGNNNGDLSCTWGAMFKRGWSSKETLAKALAGAIERGFLAKTRQGGRRVCSLFAITWEPINECGGKLDVKANPVPLNAWREWEPQKIAVPPAGAICPAERGSRHVKVVLLPRQTCQ